MKLQVDREELEEALKRAKEATEKKSALPILTNFLLEADGQSLVIRATDLENYLTVRLNAEVEEEGSCCVNSKRLSDIVRTLASAVVSMVSDQDKLLITGGRSRFKLPITSPEDFPEFPVSDGEPQVIPGNLLLKAVEKTEYAIAKDDARISLQGMYIRGVQGRIHFVGSDGHRLALYEPEGEFSGELLLPRKSLKVLQRLIAGIEDVEITKSEDGSFSTFKTEDWSLVIRLLEGEFPDYGAVMPAQFSAEILFDKNELRSSLRRLASISEGRILPVKFTLADNVAVIEISDPEVGEGRDEIDIDYIGEPFEIGFNGGYLIEALNAFDSEKVWLKFTTPDTATLLEADDYEQDPYRCIIMPMRV